MDLWTAGRGYVRKNLVKFLAPITVLVFVGLVVAYDLRLPFGEKGGDSAVVDCGKTAKDDPLYLEQCEDDALLDISGQASVARFAAGEIYDSDLAYVMPSAEDMVVDLMAEHGPAVLLIDGSVLLLPEDSRLYAYHPENSASWQNVWLAEDGTRYTLYAYMVVSRDAAKKLHSILTEEVAGYGETVNEIDEIFNDDLPVESSRTVLVDSDPDLCALVTLVQTKSIVYSVVSARELGCEYADYTAHAYLVAKVANRIASVLPG